MSAESDHDKFCRDLKAAAKLALQTVYGGNFCTAGATDIDVKLSNGFGSVTENGCILWSKATNRDGYGIIKHMGKTRYAHRESYSEFVGPIADGMQICHECDNPPCVNPMHLKQGTDEDNKKDMRSKGRQRNGSGGKIVATPSVLFTNDKVGP